MKKSILNLFVIVLTTTAVFAQNSNNPWLVSGGINVLSLQGDFSNTLNDSQMYTKGDFPSSNMGVPSLSVFRSIAGGLSIGTQFSLNSLNRETGTGSVDFFAIDAALKYAINRDGAISPYVKGGWGFSSFDAVEGGDYDFSKSLTNTFFGSFGLNFQLGDRWSAFAETSYRATQDRPEVNYLLTSAGISIGLGSGDRDKDGVSDKKDKCPDVPGLKEFEGCPDTDEDGLPDNEDDCPEVAGPIENKGCPDTDGDGVLDKDDTCPEVAGLLELNGCPDADEDGIADQEDECPEEAGDAENKGCPWPDTDGDGVLDKDDACPEESGSGENGCPEVTAAAIEALNDVGLNILFAADSSRIQGAKTIKAFEGLKAILSENSEGIILIQGHASEEGNTEYNLKLSQKRAEAVRARLIELGVDAARLEVQAFGETLLLGDNSTAEGRAKSRRVEFKSKKQ